MKTEHVALLVGAAVLGVIGVYLVAHLAGSVKPAPSIDDQLNAYR